MSFALPVPSHQPAKTVQLLRGQPRSDSARRSIRLAALRVPLVVKLVGANLAVVALLIAIRSGLTNSSGFVADAAIVIALALHVVLVLIALRPIRDLEAVAERVWQGDFGARVERSTIADHEVLRIGAMFNILLDGLVSDRARMRALAAEVIEVGDRERAVLARELHDSTAQRLAALLLQLSAASRDCKEPALAARLSDMRDMAEEITEEVRVLSHTVHPRVLDDLGLVAALHKLARESSKGTGIDIDVDADDATRRLSPSVESVLYRVAQESVRNATRHAAPRRVWMTLHTDDVSARLEVHDDGHGFDLRAVEKKGTTGGMGLLSMRERVALVDGSLEIKTAPSNGTTIVATIPLVSAQALQASNRGKGDIA
jgi:signal transduction histidine kinase